MPDEVVNLRIDIGTRGAKRNVDSLEKSVDRVGDSAKKSGKIATKQFGAMGRAIGDVRVKLLGLLSIATAGTGFILALKQAREFETGLIGVAKTTGLAGAELAGLALDIEKLSRNIPVSTKELLELGQAAGQLGVKGRDNLLRFTETIAKLGRASDLSGEKAAQTLARILNVTGESAASVATFASVLVSLGNNVAATESQIARVTNEIARTTAMFGVSSAEAAAMGAAMAAMGARAESAGSAVGRVFQEIQSRVTAGGESLRNFAGALEINGDLLAETWKEDRIAGFMMFLQATKDLGAEKSGAVLKEIGLGGQEVIKVMGPLAKNLEQYVKTQKLANAEVKNATALNREFEETLKTFDSAVIIFGNNIATIAKSFGDVFLETLTPGLKALNEQIDRFVSNQDEFEKVIQNTINAFKLLGDLIAIGGIFYIGMKVLPAIIAAATSALITLNIALGITQAAGIRFALSTVSWNEALLGTSVSARIASGSITKLGLSLGILASAFAGFQVGKYLASLDVVRGTTIQLVNDLLHGFNRLNHAFNIFGEFWSSFGDSAEEHAAAVAEIDRQYELQRNSIDAATLALHENEFGTNEASEAIKKLQKEIEDLNETLAKQKKAEDDASNAAFQMKEEYQDLLDKLFPLQKMQKEYNKDLKILRIAYTGLKKSSSDLGIAEDKLKQEYIELFPALQAYRDMLTSVFDREEARTDQVENLLMKLFPLEQLQKEYILDLELLEGLYKDTGKSTAQLADAVNRLKREYIDLFPELQKQQEAADEMATSWEKAMERIDESFADAWEGAFDSFEDFADSITKSFKKLLAELAHQAITKPILIQLGLGGSGGAAGAFAGAGTNTLSSTLMKSFGSSALGAKFSGAMSGFGSGVASGFGVGTSSGMFQMGSGSLVPAGTGTGLIIDAGATSGAAAPGITFDPITFAQTLGASIAGSFVGGKIGSQFTSKEANSSIGATIGGIGGAALGGPLGAFIGSTIGGIVDVLFGSKQKSSRFEIQASTNVLERRQFGRKDIGVSTQSAFGGVDFQSDHDLVRGFIQEEADAFFALFDSIAELEDSISSSIGASKTKQVKANVSNQEKLFKKKSLDFAEFFVERFDTIFDVIGGDVDKAFDELIQSARENGRLIKHTFGGIEDFSIVVNTFTDQELLSLLDQFSRMAFVVGEATGDFKVYLDSLNKLTLEFVAAGTVLITVNEVLSGIGGAAFDLTVSGANAAIELVEVTGSLEDFIIVVNSLSNDLRLLSDSLFGSLDIRIREEQEQIQKLNDSAMTLYELEMERFEDSIKAAKRLKDAIESTFLIGASPTETFEFKQEKFEDLVLAAKGGDAQAASDLAKFAPEFLKTAREFFASGDEFQAIKTSVLADLESARGGLDVSAVSAPTEITTSAVLENLIAKQTEQFEAQRELEEALFITALTELSLATSQDITDLLYGLGLDLEDVEEVIRDNLNLDLDDNGIITAVEALQGFLDEGSPLHTLLSQSDDDTVKNVLNNLLGTSGDLYAILSLISSNTEILDITGIIDAVADIDLNSDGIITAIELSALSFGEDLTSNFSLVDLDSNGIISAIELSAVAFEESITSNFDLIDLDSDGIISAIELSALSFGENLTTSFSLVDLNSDGIISAIELSAISFGEDLTANFDLIDLDSNGIISAIELSAVSFGEGLTTSFEELDLNSDGIISAIELSALSFGEELTANFALIDLNSDGIISAIELSAITFGGDLDRNFDLIDLNSDGIISAIELSTVVFGEDLDRNFALIDLNSDGIISAVELSAMNLGSELINSLDLDNNGIISQLELLNALLNPGSEINSLLAGIRVNTAVEDPPPVIIVNIPSQPTINIDRSSEKSDVFDRNYSSYRPEGNTSFINAYNQFNGTNFTTIEEVLNHKISTSKEGTIVPLADGGIVRHPTFAQIGEGGQPEAIVPLDEFSAQINKVEQRLNDLISVTENISSVRSNEHSESMVNREETNSILIENTDVTVQMSRTERIV